MTVIAARSVRRLFGLLVIVSLGWSCSPSSAPAPQEQTTPVPPVVTAGTHRVFGRVPVVNGAPSIVMLEPTTEREFPAQTSKPMMDQAVQTFVPDVLFVRTGQPTIFRNDDEELHNVNVRDDDTKTQAFNVAIPSGASFDFTFASDGAYGVHCDIHPAMAALVIASSSPYAAQTDATGAYAFDDVIVGGYRLVVYAGSKKFEKDVDVSAVSTEASIAEIPGSN